MVSVQPAGDDTAEFASADNERSNAVCRQTGFKLVEQRELEYEPGSFVTCNLWSLDLA